MNQTDYRQRSLFITDGARVSFGWNHIFGEPSCVFEVESMLEKINGELCVYIPMKTGQYSFMGGCTTWYMRFDDLVDCIDAYGDEVIPLTILENL